MHEYCVISEWDKEEFEFAVITAMESRWMPVGGVNVIQATHPSLREGKEGTYSISFFYSQAMIRTIVIKK